MAWEISIVPEGWEDIRKALEGWDAEELIIALGDDFYETLEGYGVDPGMAEDFMGIYMRSLREYAPHDALVEMAIGLIEKNNSCDPGGHSYWIDRKGLHKVTPPLARPNS